MGKRKAENIESEIIPDAGELEATMKKLSVSVSINTYYRIRSALVRDRNYRKKGVNFLEDAIENELIRSETAAYTKPIGEDRRKSDSEESREAASVSENLQEAVNGIKIPSTNSNPPVNSF